MYYFLGVLPTAIFSISGLVMFFVLRLGNDPDMKVARKASAALAVFELLALITALPSPDLMLMVSAGSLVVSFFMRWALIYVGLTISMRHGHTFWISAQDKAARKKILGVAALAGVAIAVLSIGYLSLMKPGLGELAKSMSGQPHTFVSTLLFILLAAVGEEFIYRGTFQNLLTHWLGDTPRARFTVINAVAVTWAVAHVGVLSPDWVKFLQIYPIGIFLGLQFRKHGLLTTIMTHAVFNLTAALLAMMTPGMDQQ